MTTPARSSSRGGRRIYSHPLDPSWHPPSVTTAIAMMSKGSGLVWWAATASADYAVQLAGGGELERRIGQDGATETTRWLAAEHTRRSRRSADLGTAVHDAVHRMTRGATLVPGEPLLLEGRAEAWGMFVRDWHPDVHFSETTVWSRAHDYAGTLDLVARVPDLDPDLPWVIDLKTGKGPYPEVALQLAAYRHAETLTTQMVGERERAMPATAGALVLMLGDRSYGLYIVDAGTVTFGWFLRARTMLGWAAHARGVLDGPLEKKEA